MDKDSLSALLFIREFLGFNEILVEREMADTVEKKLNELKEEVLKCKKCPLHQKKTNYVFGSGNPYARVMFVGEAPGADEDREGLPFVGRAGKLLTKLLKEIGLDRDRDVFIANVLKCRPPGNRDPLPSEIKACSPYLIRQIKIINPDILVALGRFAAYFLSGKDKIPLSKLRGRIMESVFGPKLLVTYHPAAILRNPGRMHEIKNDFRLLKKFLETEVGEGK